MKEDMYYYGTALTCSGHHFSTLEDEYMLDNQLNIFNNILPFNPEALPYQLNQPKGYLEFHVIKGWSIIAIEGSCTDTREGTCSIFFIDKIVTYEEMVKRMLDIPIVNTIISQMPFEVQWEDKE